MRKKLLSVACALAVALGTFAVPAYRGTRTVTLTDGTQVQAQMNGDEFCHYLTNADGQVLIANENGAYKIASNSAEVINKQRMQAKVQSRFRKASKLNLAPRGLVILANYTDKSYLAANTTAQMDSMMNAVNYTFNGATGSIRKYFSDQSNGSYIPHFDVVGPVNLPHNMAYYGANDADDNDVLPGDLTAHACSIANEQFNVNFANYDNDNDGYVDFVYILYAGYGEADGGSDNTIWPHSWDLESAISYGNATISSLPVYDGKTINNYACSAELTYSTSTRCGIGTICHEFSHVLGLPDLYATDYSTHKTMGEWDILDYGPYNNNGRTPPAYSAYERFFMGWLTPEVLASAGHYQLPELQANNKAYLISSTGAHNLIGTNPTPTSFYLLENRQQTGWDAYIPGHGMLVTKINYSTSRWEANTVNNTAGSLGVDIIEADGSAPSNSYGKQGDVFPTTSVTTFTPYTTYPLTAITQTSGLIAFDFMGGVAQPYTVSFNAGTYGTCATTSLTEAGVGMGVTLPTVVVTNPADGYTFEGWSTTATARTADAGSAGTGYFPTADITLYAVYLLNGANPAGECFEEHFLNCTAASSSDVTSTLDNYCDNEGWTGLKVFCNDGELKIGSSKVAGYAITPALGLTGNVSLTYDAQNYTATGNGTLSLSVEGDGTLSTTTQTITSTMTTYTANLTGCTASTKIKFSSSQRFYLDEIMACGGHTTGTLTVEENAVRIAILPQGLRIDQLPSQAQVSLYNAQGQLLQSMQPVSESCSFSIPQGLYLIRVETPAQASTYKALVY